MKESEWRPLSESTRGLIAKLRPKVSDFAGGPNPIFAKRKLADWKWKQRRFFVAFGQAVSIMWVDDDGSCANQHLTHSDGSTPGEWHQYEDAKNRAWAVRCPSSLGAEFKVRLESDVPPGHAYNRLRESKENRRESGRQRNIKRVQQRDME